MTKNLTDKIVNLFSIKGSYLEVMNGLYNIKTLKKENPYDCGYVRNAIKLFKEEELFCFINKLKEIIKLYDEQNSTS